MSDCIVNLRFGYSHLQIGFWFVRITKNQYWIDNKPDNYFELY